VTVGGGDYPDHIKAAGPKQAPEQVEKLGRCGRKRRASDPDMTLGMA